MKLLLYQVIPKHLKQKVHNNDCYLMRGLCVRSIHQNWLQTVRKVGYIFSRVDGVEKENVLDVTTGT